MHYHRLREGATFHRFSTNYTELWYGDILIAHKLRSRISWYGSDNGISFVYDRTAPHSRNQHYSWLRHFYGRKLTGLWDSCGGGELDYAIMAAEVCEIRIVPWKDLTPEEIEVIEYYEKGKHRD